MKRVLFFGFLLAGVLMLAVSPALAGPGKIAGKVVDSSGEPVIGASVQVTETKQGAAVGVDGQYVILGVQPGSYTVRISSVGYAPQSFRDVGVSGDLTTTLNATLTEEAIQTTEQIITYTPPAVKIDVSSKEVRITAKDMQTRAVPSIAGMLKKQPGFKVDPAGEMHVRGGRGADMLVKVDGMDFRDPLVTGSKQLVNMSALNVEEIEVLTGGDARYGGFQAALINVTTPEGSMTDYSGVLEYRTDRLFKTADPYKPFYGQSNKLWNASFDQDQYDYSLSGPVPFADRFLGKQKLSFFTSGTARMGNTYTPYSISRSPADILGVGIKLPERQDNDYSTFWKFTYRMDQKRKLNLSFQRDYQLYDIYPDGEAAVDGNYGWQYKYNVANRPFYETTRQSVSLSFSHNVSKTTLYEISVGNFTTNTTIRSRGKNPDEFTLSKDAEDDSRRVTGGVDQDKNGFPDGYVDANRNGKYDGQGEGYDDVNANGRWDRGEDWVDLNGNGVYDEAEPWVDVADPVTGRNNLGVKDPWDPYVDLNKNGRWDPAEPQLAEQDWNHNGKWDGERFQDANKNGKYDGFGEGFDDKNSDGKINTRDLFDASKEALGEPFVDGDQWFDTGEPFIDLPDSNGNYNGVWDSGEYWYDLPSSYVSAFQRSGTPTTDGIYDGPNSAFDEYELFTYPARMEFGTDPRYPVLYTYGDVGNGMRDAGGRYTGQDWLNLPMTNGIPGYYHYIEGKSTWTNVTLDDGGSDFSQRAHWIFDPPNNVWDNGKQLYPGQTGHLPRESYTDYNGNGTQDPLPDFFLNPGQYDATALWEKRQSSEWSAKFDLTSQVNKFHEMKTGFELKYRTLTMNSISGPDQPYTNTDVPLPAGSPYPDRGAIRDFYKHRPWEGALYVQDKMEFEGMIVRAGLRSDFVIQPNDLIDETQKQLDKNQPGALLAQRGRFTIAPRLGISHPISAKSKLYFNYGHYYQTPQFQYFYTSATANLSPNTLVGNPNLEYEKTVSYEVGVNSEFAEDWVIDVAGYYRDVFNQIGTVQFRDGPLVFNRYFNLGYARARGFEFSLEKKFSSMWALTTNYDFSYAYGKESAAADGLLNRNTNVPENYDEHPLNWDQTHTVSAYLTLMISDKDHPKPLGMKIPNNWLATLEFTYGSGYPYTPSTYTTGVPANQILTNSARMPATVSTDLKFDKFWNLSKKLKLATGFEIYNLLNRGNVRAIYPATGTTGESINRLDPTWVPGRSDSDMNPRNYSAPRQILLHVKLSV
ncbi:MAG TPA: outer membrane beta-barrel protein [bacterium]